MTASLLNSWKWTLNTGDADSFMKTLRREPTPKTEAMVRGDEFEAWAYKNIPEVMVGQHQLALKRYSGNYLLYGRLDSLHAGVIYDLKYTGHYEVGKFFGSPQTSMYFELVPDAKKFIYIISDGKELYREEYQRQEAEPIMSMIHDFDTWLRLNNLRSTYEKHWLAYN